MKNRVTTTELVAKGNRPTDIIRIEEIINPITRNFRASDLSDRAPIKNLLKA
jgi:hypothetical protein